jgi:hypothetical protein
MIRVRCLVLDTRSLPLPRDSGTNAANLQLSHLGRGSAVAGGGHSGTDTISTWHAGPGPGGRRGASRTRVGTPARAVAGLSVAGLTHGVRDGRCRGGSRDHTGTHCAGGRSESD